MPDLKISALTELTSPDTDDVLAIVDTSAATTKKIQTGKLVNCVPGLVSIPTAAATTTLTVASKGMQVFTGVTTQTVVLPVVTTLPQLGFQYAVLNDSSGIVTVNSSGSNLVKAMAAGSRAMFTCVLLTGTAAASWDVTYVAATSGITNSAGANVVTKSDGTNLVASRITDNGTNVAIDSGAGTTTIGDVNGAANGTTLTIDGSDLATFSGGVQFGGDINPNAPNGGGLGGPSVPWTFAYIGNAATNNIQLTGTATGARVATLQDLTQTLVGRAATVALTAQAASIGSTALAVNGGVAPSGLYRLSYYLVTTTAGTSGTVSATFGWTDLGAARTSGSGSVTFGSLAAPVTGTLIIQADGIANVTYLTTVTAAVGNPRYALNVSLERLQ